MENKRLLTLTLKLYRERGDDHSVARTLGYLSDVNRRLGLNEEGLRLAREALEIHQRLGETAERARCLKHLAWLLYADKQFEAAEDSTLRAITLLQKKADQSLVCECHRILGDIYHSKGETEKAINHFKTALDIASSSNINGSQFWVHFSLAELFHEQGKLNDAHAHIERAKSHEVNNTYLLARAARLQAKFWYQQRRLEEAKSEALCAIGGFEKLGVARYVEDTRKLLRQIEGAMKKAQGNKR